MINLGTPPDLLMKELLADRDKAEYWLKKKCGGDKGYIRMQDRLIVEARRKRDVVVSDFYEYRSPNGNRWMTYECARYFKDTAGVLSQSYTFCFYETEGSCGIFLPVKLGMNRVSGKDGCLIFTSHFFLRFAERTEMQKFDAPMLQLFVKAIPHLTLTINIEEDIRKVDARLPGGVGRGVCKNGCDNVFEIRTFLKDGQLSRHQQRQTETLRSHGDHSLYVPEEVRIDRILHGKDMNAAFKREMKEMKTMYTRQGMDGDKFDNIIKTGMWMTEVWMKMGLLDGADDNFWVRHQKQNSGLVNDFAKEGSPKEQFLNLLEACSNNLGLKKFDRDKAAAIVEKL